MNTPSLVFLFFFFFFFSVALSSSPAHSKYFTFELVHRDSPLSPIYNPRNTATERHKAAFLRSISRSRRFNQNTDLQSGLIIGADPGDYLMSITIGTPPQKFHALVDTGSDLIWVQCKPCQNCAKAIDPPFNNKNSSTYKSEPCDSPHCNLLNGQTSCDMNGNLCQYNYKYGDESFSTGYIATETISINSASGSPVSFPGTIIGCGYTKHGHFDETGSGIIGLGDGPLSLISQLSSSITKKFSYCLSHNTKAKSYINLGTNLVPSGLSKHSRVISTPLDSANNNYYLTLEAISVGKRKIPYLENSSNPDAGRYSKTMGNIIIDSGTPWTLLDPGYFNKFLAVVEESITGAKRCEPVLDFTDCFKADNAKIRLPKITVHFTGADIRLSEINAFVKMGADTFCLSMHDTTGHAIYGSYAQMDFFVGYDLVTRTVSFQHMDCSAKS